MSAPCESTADVLHEHNASLLGTGQLPAPSLLAPHCKKTYEGKRTSTCMQARLLEEVLDRAEKLGAIGADQGHVPLLDAFELVAGERGRIA